MGPVQVILGTNLNLSHQPNLLRKGEGAKVTVATRQVLLYLSVRVAAVTQAQSNGLMLMPVCMQLASQSQVSGTVIPLLKYKLILPTIREYGGVALVV